LKIKQSNQFKEKLQHIVQYIKQDKQDAAINFAKQLKNTIKALDNSPYRYRKSIYFDDKNVRDMTFKGYTIVYKIYPTEDEILIVDIFNQNKPME
jgi:plasmid stabilization system protein ParE